MEKQKRAPFFGLGRGRAGSEPENEAAKRPAAPEAAPDMGAQGDDAMFEELVTEFYELSRQGKLPEGFELEAACADPAFMELLMELQNESAVYAAIRVYASERGKKSVEADTKRRVLDEMQSRKRLVPPMKTGVAASGRPDYGRMSSAEFKKLEQRYKEMARAGMRVPL